MRRSTLAGLALRVTVVLAIAAVPACAKDKKPRQGELNGTVRSISKDSSTIIVRKGNADRQIVYSANTKFVKGTQRNSIASSIDELKDGWYVHCWGNFDGIKLIANRCRLREEQRTTQP